MINIYLSNGLRFLLLTLLQVLVLKNMQLGGAELYIELYIYPLFVLLLPMRLPAWALIGIAFVHGILIDVFYDSMGLHAASMVLIAFLRPILCAQIEPRGGYEVDEYPTKARLGMPWFLRYAGILMFIHVFFVVFLQELSISQIFILKLLLSYLFSMTLIILYQYIINPKY